MAAFADRKRVEEIARLYATLVREQLGASRVYLYGSYAKGTHGEDSDIDIAVIGDQFSGDKVNDTLKLMKLRRKVDTRIEPHPFTPSEFDMSDPYVSEIVRTGIRIL